MKDDLAALFHAFCGAGALILSFFSPSSLPGPTETFQAIGWGFFLGGFVLFGLSLVFLKRAFLGNVTPTTDILVTEGPYRYVRHPVYLSMIMLTLAFALLLRSLWGLLFIPLFFVPASIFRARLEEEALSGKFGDAWHTYASSTHFIIPPLC